MKHTVRTLLRSRAAGLSRAAAQSVRFAKRHMRTLGIAGVVCLVAYYFIWKHLYPGDYESLVVRSLGGLICVPAILATQLQIEKSWFKTYWIVALTVVLPFVFGFLLAMNAAVASGVGTTNLIWPLQYVVSLFILILLVNHGPLATLMWIAATAVTCGVVALLVPDPNWAELHRVYIDPMPMYAFILVIGSLANRNREIIELEKLSAMASVGTTIAHELRTPFLGMRALVEGIEKYIPTLLHAYDLAVSNRLPVERIRLAHVRALNRSLELIRDELDYSNSVVDMLLVNSSEHPVRESEFETFSAAVCVRHAISRYAFTTDAEKTLIKTDLERDFDIRAPRVLVVHVLFNLLKNALYYVRKAGRGDITISLAPGERFNVMIVHDTGTGVPEEILDRIFERFFTTTETGQGAGIGLSFCEIVLNGIGGSIRCESELGRFTRFILEFPHAEPHD